MPLSTYPPGHKGPGFRVQVIDLDRVGKRRRKGEKATATLRVFGVSTPEAAAEAIRHLILTSGQKSEGNSAGQSIPNAE